METLTEERRYHGGKKAGEGKNGREQRWILLNNLEDVPVPSGEQFMQHTHVHTGATCYQYCCCCSTRLYQLLSPEQEMCGRHGDGSATRFTTLLIKTCQRRCVPYARGCVFPFQG